MNTRELIETLPVLFSELIDGPPGSKGGAYILNPGDIGLMRSLDKLSADAASASTPDGGTIAAHVDHLRFGIALMNRWANGEPDPFTGAAWDASWRITTVDDARWNDIREGLRTEAHQWLAMLRRPRDVDAIELNGIVGSIAHLAYHLGAIRQIDRTARGPKATSATSS